MAKDYSRTQRIGDSLQQELARLLQFTLSDPRLKMVSVTGVDVSRDLSHAKVFFTQMGVDDAQAAAETTSALDRASGFLRSEIARTATLRTVPKLRFCFDESVGRGRDMETLIRKVRAADIELGSEPDSEEDE
ncbi:MAG: 30S ribosome-binding factor RbfA [Luminiphilus sp.]|nr:30S ribosome-binding factor RbfA [Halieaceae bacterium]MDG1493936.1 30S ribosome-binding factor RbfA [Luminiphilus sp.]MDG1828818.1 30S ribosome-binding factor RbfA [Luminiphilus sp.]MDG2138092.1 30S ribosome-binding factor RbfA [Luminiphilus sp.]MDG2494415.1 30S ribosome-binding factor RbfA [Luminiphilus sp.]